MRALVSLLVALTLAIASPALAAGKGKGKGNGNGQSGHADSSVTVGDAVATGVMAAVLITTRERSIILDYFATPPAAYAGAKPLPPGIARKLARGGTLPPGIAKRYFPHELVGQLPPRPGYKWVVVGTDVVLLAAATGIIVDLLSDVF